MSEMTLPLVCRLQVQRTAKRISLFRRFPFQRVNWKTSSFLIGTLALSLTAVPLYLWKFGIAAQKVISPHHPLNAAASLVL